MKISEKWLREFVDFKSSPAEISEALNMLGIEVEAFDDQAGKYKGFVTAKVVSKEKHPKADKLSVCQVFDGSVERTVVCGAPNVEAGQTVVFALPGAVVPNGGFTIEPRKLRGIESNGMICSRAELLLDDDHSGIWVLGEDVAIGQPIAAALGLDDVIYEISITPNRADALSHLGIARVIAAYENCELKKPQAQVIEGERANDVRIRLDRVDLCPRYAARVVRDVQVQESPLWMKQRLEAVGLRPRNAIVDITNYVLMECGHPLHAFDYDFVNNQQIVVRTAQAGESFVTLDDKQRTLDNETLMICDEQHSLAIAGVMGGQQSAISNATKNVLIESAYFNPSSIRRSARKQAISSDASYRFERGVDIENCIYAVNRAAQLMHEMAGGVVDKGIVDEYPVKVEQRVIRVRPARVRSILGFEISDNQIAELFRRLDFGCSINDDATLELVVPSFRVDIHEEIDCIEEIAILFNYDNIPVVTDAVVSFATSQQPVHLTESSRRRALRDFLASNGFNEIVTQNQTDPQSEAAIQGDGVELANPLGVELSVMRSSLISSMMKVVSFNIRQGNTDLRFFDIAKTFHRSPKADSFIEGISEQEEICVALSGNAEGTEWYGPARRVDFYDAKGMVVALLSHWGVQADLRPSQRAEFGPEQAEIWSGEQCLGAFGIICKTLHQQYDCAQPVYALQCNLDLIEAVVRPEAKYSAISLYPGVERDLAFVVDKSTASSAIEDLIKRHGGAILRDVHVFDLFEHPSLGEGRKSLAYRLSFLSHERTLTDEDVDSVIRNIVQSAQSELHASLRS